MHGLRWKAHAPRGGLGELGHTGRVLAQPRRLETGDRGDGGECRVDPVARDEYRWSRLGPERALPHPRLVQSGEDVGEALHGERGQCGLVRSARSALDDSACLVGARCGEEQGDISRHVQETHRQRDRLTGDAWKSPPVPAREDVLERGLDARIEAEPPGEPLRHLAHHRERVTGPRAGVGDRVLDQLLADLGAAADPDVRFVEREDLRGLVGSMR